MGKSRFRLKQSAILAASISLLFSDPTAWANPTGPQVVNGTVGFQRPNAGTLNVSNSPGAIINWQGFSIGASEVTRFIQQSSSSAVLNRVVGADISQLHGQLLSNGRVFLINPAGIIVGPGAVIDTAGFVASTLNMMDADFLAGKLKFQGDANSGSIVNQGWIRTSYGGQVILVAPNIENSGLIHTPGGELLLAAGQKLAITSLDLDGVQFEVQAPTDSVLNVGKLLADGGAVGVFAGTLRHSGEIRANALVYDEAGRVILKAQNEIQIASGSSSAADGKSGGSVTVQSSDGLTRVAGNISAQGTAGQGGNIRILGDRVAIVENATLNVSGTSGGGSILVGGDFQGANPAIQNSVNTFVGAGATLRADATESGDGGRIIVWSDDKTQFYGDLSAQGGPQGGDGGFAEVSGKQNLIFAGGADLGAPKGKLGTLLLDPLDLYVFGDTPPSPPDGGGDATIINESTDFPGNAATVSPTTLAGITGNVSLFASRYMRISDDITLTGAGQGLSAQVGAYTPPALPDPLAQSTAVPNGRLEVEANITTAGGAVSLVAPTIQSFSGSTITTGGGAISLNTSGSTIQASGLSLDAGSGAVTATSSSSIQLNAVTGGSFTATAPGSIDVFGAITTSGGAVSLASSGSFVRIFDGAMTGGGSVTLTGASSVQNFGTIASGAGNVSLSGTSVTGGTIDTSGNATLTASRGNISATVNNAGSVIANASHDSSSASVSLFSQTVLNAADVKATTTNCFSNGSCSGATIFLSGDQGVNVGTVTATAPANFVNQVSFGDTYADPRFESINERVTIISSNGPIRAMSSSSSVTAADVELSTGTLSGGGIGQLGATPLPMKVDVERTFTFKPNGEFNVELTGSGPNNLVMEIGVAPAGGPGYTGTLTKTDQITLNVTGTSDTVTASTFNVASGFDQRVLNNSPGISLFVPNGKLVANDVKVPAGDVTGASSPSARRNCDVFGGMSCPPAIIIEPLSVTLRSDQALQVDSYIRASGTVAKQTTFRSDNAGVTLGTIAGNRDGITVFGRGDISIADLTTTGFASVTSSPFFPATGSITITRLSANSGTSVSAGNGDVTVGLIDTLGGTGSVTISANAGTVQAAANVNAVEVQSAGAVNISATAIASTSTNPLDVIGSSVSLTSQSGGTIGSAGTPVVARTNTLTVNAGANFNVDTGTVDILNLTLTADPMAVGNNGLARVTSNGQTYNFASDGANFTLGGANFPMVPATQFAGGTLSFTATSGNLTLNALDFSASNGNFSAATSGNLANITQTAAQAVNLGTGVLTLKADGNVALEGVNAGGLNVANATSIVGSGCSTTFGPCGVTSFTANQTLIGTGTWTVTSRGAITTGALQVAGIDFTTNGSGNITTGAIGTAGTPASSVSMSTTSGSGGSVQINGPVEADSFTVSARGNVTIGTGSLPTDQANLIINASNTDAASIDLSTQAGTITVNGALNASSVTLTSPTAIAAGNINPTAASPTSITFRSTSAVDISTGSLDAKSVVAQSACFFYCPPGDITINGAIGGNTLATTVSLDGANGSVLSIAGPVSLDPAVATNLFMQSSGAITLGGALTSGTDQNFRIFAGTTLTGTGGDPLGVVTAGDGSSITLRASNSNIATPFQFTSIDAGASGSVTINAPAGIIQTLATGSGGGIKVATVNLSATSTGSAIVGPGGFAPLPLTLRETSDLTLNAGGSINVDRVGASGVPLLSNLDITRSSSFAAVSLTGFAAGQAVTISNDTMGGGANVDLINTSGTPLNFTYRNTDSTNGNLTVTGTGIATKGGNVFLSATQNLTTGAIDTKSGVAMVPDGSITLQASQALDISGTVDSGAAGINGSAAGISGAGQLVSTSANSVTLTANSGNIGTSGTPLAVSAPTVTLRATGSNPSGNVFSALTGTNNLTLDADDGFTVTSSVPLSTLNLTTFSTGVGPVSLTTDTSQNFGFVRNGTTLDITGVTSTAPLTSFTLTTIGSLTTKGSIAANNLTLNASGGTLMLDGSAGALTLSNVTQDLDGQNVVITGTVNASATSSQSIFGSSSVNFTGTGTLSSGGSQSIDSFGNVDITSQGGAINITGISQFIGADGNLTFSAAGGAITGSGANQTVRGDGSTSVITLQGGSAAGQSVTFSASGSQLFQTPDLTSSSIRLLGGGGTDAAASIVYTGTGTQNVQGGDVILTAGTAAGAAATISTATGSQLVRANRDIKLTADAAEAKIVSTSGSDQQVGESRCVPVTFGCSPQPYRTDNVILQGGTGVEAAITATGFQKVQADLSIQVLGGTGVGGAARIETTSATQEQRIGCGASGSNEFCTSTLDSLTLVAGANGAFAQVVTPGVQRMLGTSNLTLTGHADNGGYARISSAGTLQTIQFGNTALTAGQGAGSDAEIIFSGTGLPFQDSQTLNFSGLTLTGGGTAGGNTAVARISSSDTRTDQNAQRITAFGTIQLTGGAGPDSVTQITTAGRQNLSLGSVTMKGGTGSGSFARINTPAMQTLSFSSLTLDNSALTTGSGSYAKVDSGDSQALFGGSITLKAAGVGETTIDNAGAIIEGHSQSFSGSAISMAGGAGTTGNTSDAVMRNLSGSQSVSASNITLQGGHQHSTTGILNLGTGTQTISGSGGITLLSDPITVPAHADAFVLIHNQPATLQTISASSGGVRLDNSGDGRVEIASGTRDPSTNAILTTGDQKVTARYVEVTTSAGTGSSTLSATGNQAIRTTSQNASGESVVVAAMGSGTAKIESGASQLLEIGYPGFMQGFGGNGVLSIGQANTSTAAGDSLVLATDQSVFAGSILVQGPSGASKISKLSATNTQTISTLLGGIDVLGGAGTDSLATIDPVMQTILANDTIALVGGPGPGTNADASIVGSGTQTIFSTNGDITLTGGATAGSDAFISTAGFAQTISTVGTLTLTANVGSASISNGGGIVAAAPFTCGVGCVLAPAPATTALIDTTSLILPLSENQASTLFETTAEGQQDEFLLGRKIPICR
ncbi:MAG: filamentous hemagglutinin N-terminal domain-containing protein [Betaproteobacteria bacterium]|nr:filamentous hemagglutinin N-terminal domain-containing protein [Betaproteobacteria bacterium]